MSLTIREYRGEVLAYLRDAYGVTNAEITPGGSHPKLRFTYGGRPHVLTMNNTVQSSTAVAMKKQDIRRELGAEPELPEQRKTNMNSVVNIDSKASRPRSVDVRVSRTRAYLEVTIPDAARGLVGWGPDVRLCVEPMGSDMWSVRLGARGTRGLSSLITNGPRTFARFRAPMELFRGLPLFGASPAEAVASDGNRIVALRGPTVPLRQISRKKRSDAAVDDAPPVPLEAAAEEIPATAPAIDPEACLRMIQAIESSGPYRLVKLADGGWVFRAPTIRLGT